MSGIGADERRWVGVDEGAGRPPGGGQRVKLGVIYPVFGTLEFEPPTVMWWA